MSAVSLVPLDETHRPALAELELDPDAQRFTRVPIPPPADFPQTFLRSYREGRHA